MITPRTASGTLSRTSHAGGDPKLPRDFQERIIAPLLDRRRRLAEMGCLAPGVEVAPRAAAAAAAAKPALVACASRLLGIGEYATAAAVFQEAIDAADFDVARRVDAIYGLIECEVLRIRRWDPATRYPRTAQRLFDCLRRAQRAMADLLTKLPPEQHERASWLFLNGAGLVHCVAEPLARFGGNFARHAAEFLFWGARVLDAVVSLATTKYLPLRCRLYALAATACDAAGRPTAVDAVISALKASVASLRGAEEMQLPLPEPIRARLEAAETDVALLEFRNKARRSDSGRGDRPVDDLFTDDDLFSKNQDAARARRFRALALYEALGDRRARVALEEEDDDEKPVDELATSRERAIAVACAEAAIVDGDPSAVLLPLPHLVALARQLFVLREGQKFRAVAAAARRLLSRKRASPPPPPPPPPGASARTTEAGEDTNNEAEEEEEEDLVEGAAVVFARELDLLCALDDLLSWNEGEARAEAVEAAVAAEEAKAEAKSAKKEYHHHHHDAREEEDDGAGAVPPAAEHVELARRAEQLVAVAADAAADALRVPTAPAVPVRRAQRVVDILKACSRGAIGEHVVEWRPDLLADAAVFFWKRACEPLFALLERWAAGQPPKEEQAKGVTLAVEVSTSPSRPKNDDDDLWGFFAEAAAAVHATLERIDLDDAFLRGRVGLALAHALRESAIKHDRRSDSRRALQALDAAATAVGVARCRAVQPELHAPVEEADHVQLARQSITTEIDEASVEAAERGNRLGAHGYGGSGIFGAASGLDSLHQALAALDLDLVAAKARIELELSPQHAEPRLLAEHRKHGAAKAVVKALAATETADLGEALDLLRAAAERETRLLGQVAPWADCPSRLGTDGDVVVAKENDDDAPPAPALSSRSRTSITLQPRTWRRAGVDHLRLFGKPAGAGIDVSLTSVEVPGTGAPIRYAGGGGKAARVTAFDLCPGEHYVFAVAAFDAKGEPVSSIGATCAPIEAINPLPLPLCYGLVAARADELGAAVVSAAAARRVYQRLVDVDAKHGYALRPHVWRRASLAELYVFVECALLLAARPDNGGLPTAYVPGVVEPDDDDDDGGVAVVRKKKGRPPMPPPMPPRLELAADGAAAGTPLGGTAQVVQLTKVQILVCAVEVAVSLDHDPELVLDVSRRAYDAASPLLNLRAGPTASLVFKPLATLHQALWLVKHAWDAPIKRVFASLALRLAEAADHLAEPEAARAALLGELEEEEEGEWDYDAILKDEPVVAEQQALVDALALRDTYKLVPSERLRRAAALARADETIAKARDDAAAAWTELVVGPVVAKKNTAPEEEAAPPLPLPSSSSEPPPRVVLRRACLVARLGRPVDVIQWFEAALCGVGQLGAGVRRVLSAEAVAEVAAAAERAAGAVENEDDPRTAAEASARRACRDRVSYLSRTAEDPLLEPEEAETDAATSTTTLGPDEIEEMLWLAEIEAILGKALLLEGGVVQKAVEGDGPLAPVEASLVARDSDALAEASEELAREALCAAEEPFLHSQQQQQQEGDAARSRDQRFLLEAAIRHLARAAGRAKAARHWRQLCGAATTLWNEVVVARWVSPLAFEPPAGLDPAPFASVARALLDAIEAPQGDNDNNNNAAETTTTPKEGSVGVESEEETAAVSSERGVSEALADLGPSREFVVEFVSFASRALASAGKWAAVVRLARRLTRTEALTRAAQADLSGGRLGAHVRDAHELAGFAQRQMVARAAGRADVAERELAEARCRVDEATAARIAKRRGRRRGDERSADEVRLEARATEAAGRVAEARAAVKVAERYQTVLKKEAADFLKSRSAAAEALDACRRALFSEAAASRGSASTVVASYRRAERLCRREPLLVAQALQDRGDLHAAEGALQDATACWHEALDALFSTLDVAERWRDELPKLLRRRVGILASLVGATLAGKLALWARGDADKRLDRARFCAALAKAAFSTTLPHPGAACPGARGRAPPGDALFANYRPFQLAPRGDALFACPRRLSLAGFEAALRSSALALLARDRALEALPACCLLEHAAETSRKGPRRARVLRLRALSAAGLVDRAVDLLADLAPPRRGPSSSSSSSSCWNASLPPSDAPRWLVAEEEDSEEEDPELGLARCELLGALGLGREAEAAALSLRDDPAALDLRARLALRAGLVSRARHLSSAAMAQLAHLVGGDDADGCCAWLACRARLAECALLRDRLDEALEHCEVGASEARAARASEASRRLEGVRCAALARRGEAREALDRLDALVENHRADDRKDDAFARSSCLAASLRRERALATASPGQAARLLMEAHRLLEGAEAACLDRAVAASWREDESNPTNLYLPAVRTLATVRCALAENALDLEAAQTAGIRVGSTTDVAASKLAEAALGTMRHCAEIPPHYRATALYVAGRAGGSERHLLEAIRVSANYDHDHGLARDAAMELVSLYYAAAAAAAATKKKDRLHRATHFLDLAATLREKRDALETLELRRQDLPFELPIEVDEDLGGDDDDVARYLRSLKAHARGPLSDVPRRLAACLHASLRGNVAAYDACCLDAATLDPRPTGDDSIPRDLVCVQWLSLPHNEEDEGLYPMVEAYVLLGVTARFSAAPHLLKVRASRASDVLEMRRRVGELRYELQCGETPSDHFADKLLCDIHLFLNPHTTNAAIPEGNALDADGRPVDLACDLETLSLLENFLHTDRGTHATHSRLCYYLRDLWSSSPVDDNNAGLSLAFSNPSSL